MVYKQYLLDANIVIQVWNKYPNLLDTIENIEGIDYKIPEDIAGELSIKEYVRFNKDFVLSNKFLKLLPHIIKSTDAVHTKEHIPRDFIKYTQNKDVYFVTGDKISINDYSLIDICEKNKEYTLVTDDKKMLRSAKTILDSSKILNFEGFVQELKELKILQWN